MLKKIFVLVALLALAAAPSFAQNLGYKVTTDFENWQLKSNSTNDSTHLIFTVRGDAAGHTPGGEKFSPLATTVPVTIDPYGAHPENKTPSAVSCSLNGLQDSCTFTVSSLTYSHPAGTPIVSNDHGVQEAINALGGSAGTVVVPTNSTASAGNITGATGTTSVLIKKLNAGAEVWYTWGGSAYASSFDVSSVGSNVGNQAITGTAPREVLTENDQTTDETIWDISANAKHFTIRTRTDADGAGITAFDVTRGTGTAVSAVTVPKFTNSALTSGRVVISGAAGLEADDSDLTFATDTLSATNLVVATALTNTALTATRVPFASTGGLFVDDSDMTFATDTLTVTKLVGSTSLNTPLINRTAGALALTTTTSGNITLQPAAAATAAVTTNTRFETAAGASVITGSCSSGDCTLGGDGNLFLVSGTTTVDGFATSGWQTGSFIIIHTDGNLTLNNAGTVAGGFAALSLVGAANVSMTANDYMFLVYDGTTWNQVAPTLVK